jgi:phage shock protein C
MDEIVKMSNGERSEFSTPEDAGSEAPKRMLFRSPTDKLIGGVCGGMADFLGWDPSLVRIAWVVLTLVTGGGGILAYIALWILLPVGTVEDGEQRPAAIALNENNLARIAFILIALGGLWLLANVGILPWVWHLVGGIFRVLFWPALLIGAGYLILRYTGRGLKWNVDDTAQRVKTEVNGRMPSKDDVKSGMRNMRQNFPLKRSSTDKIFMGVCGGIGQKLGIDANLVRLVWAAFSIGSIGMGVLVYVLIGLFLPVDQPNGISQYNDEPQDVTIVDATAG